VTWSAMGVLLTSPFSPLKPMMQSLDGFRYTQLSTERKAIDYVYITLQCKENDNENKPHKVS